MATGDVVATVGTVVNAEPGVGVGDGAVLAKSVLQGVSGSAQAVLEWRAGQLGALVLEGEPAPGFPAGSIIDRASGNPIDWSYMESGGRVAFRAYVIGPGVSNANDEGIFYRDPSGLALVVRQGDPAPGVSPTAYFANLQIQPVIVPDGRVVVNGRWQDGSVQGYGVWTWTPGGGLVLEAKSGDPIPGGSETFSSVGALLTLPTGELLIGGGFAAETRSGVWIDTAGGLVKLGAGDDPAPGFPPGSLFNHVWATNVNAAGDVLIRGTVRIGTYDERALYVWSAGTLTPIALPGQVVTGAGPNDVMGGFVAYDFNDAGHVLFSTQLQGPCDTCPTQALMLARNGALEVLVTNLVTPPGISPANARIQSFLYAAIDPLDRVAFQASFSLGESGVFGWTGGSGIFPIVMPGQQVLRPSGDHATVRVGYVAAQQGVGGSSGQTPCLDAPGEVVVSIAYTLPETYGVYSASWTDLLTLYAACPVVTATASAQWVAPSQTATISVAATGGAPLAYRWTRNGVDLYDGGNVSGADTATLTISSVTTADSATYAARVSNPCGSVDGPPTVLEVAPGTPYCAGDNTGQHCPCAPSAVGAAVGCLNSLGVGGKLRSAGEASLSADTAALIGSQMPNSSALYFQGTAAANGGAGVRFGDGLRCAAGAVVRLGIRQNSGGSSSYPVVGDAPLSVRGQVLAPGVRYYQVWYRNSTSFCDQSTFNLSNGLAVTWIP